MCRVCVPIKWIIRLIIPFSPGFGASMRLWLWLWLRLWVRLGSRWLVGGEFADVSAMQMSTALLWEGAEGRGTLHSIRNCLINIFPPPWCLLCSDPSPFNTEFAYPGSQGHTQQRIHSATNDEVNKKEEEDPPRSWSRSRWSRRRIICRSKPLKREEGRHIGRKTAFHGS